MPPLAHFTHEFFESDTPIKDLVLKADVILANLKDIPNKELLQYLAQTKHAGTKLILLSEKDQFHYLTDILPSLYDIWALPMSEEEICFHFLRWQQACKMEKDFWQTSHYLESTINSVPNLIWYKDKTGIHEKVNDSFCKTVNKTKEQVEGQEHAYIWDVEENDPACIESELEVMTKRATCVSEEIIQTGEGTRQLTTYKSPLYDLDGSVMGTVGVAIDVTQERAYEQELIRNNEILATIFSTMDCGVLCHTLDGSKILNINRAALKILGYHSQDDLLKEGFDMVAASTIDEDKAELKECITKLKKEGDSASMEYRVRHPNGEIIHVMTSIKVLQEHGELFYQRLLLDCTEKKLREEKERKDTERRQMELVQALSLDYKLVCFFDLDTGHGNVLRIDDCENHILSATFHDRLSLQECMARYIETCVYTDDKEIMVQSSLQSTLKKELTEKQIYYVNYRALCNGEIKYFQMKVVRAGAWDKSHGIVLGLRSVDEETRNEMEKKNLLENALLQANRASKAKSIFLSNMSHDIRTPMNAIVGFTTLAITHIDNKDQVEEYLKKIITSGNHLLSLINDILDMSRIESGKMCLDEKPCSLPEVLHGLRNIVQADIHAKQLELYIDAVDVWDEEVYCDKLRLNQVLLNLLSNSIKYTGAGGIVSMRISEKPGVTQGFRTYEFYIKDTGIGMSKEFISHIFEPFERERNTTLSKIQGTGLGMAITKNIVDMMNGSIEVRSEQGVGTEFIVSFPFRLYSGTKEPQTIPELKNCRVLIVDDDFNTCDSVSYMLQQIGMRAEWTLSGKEAVLRTHQAIARHDHYCVYIIDWLLPDMNGIEVTRRIRKETNENVPIIVLTAYDWSDIEEEAREAGVTGFCSKPLFLSDLRNCLRSIIHAPNTEKQAKLTPAKLRSGRILLVEDNELNQEIATVLLNEAGFEIEVADNGQIAVEMLKDSKPGYYRLILMDIQMPVMNGYEAATTIRNLENKELSSIPILAMTANAFEEDKQETIRCGMNGHIAKPINIEKLFETLDTILLE